MHRADGIYEATAYVMSGGSGTTWGQVTKTSTGVYPRRLITVAVDPKVIPYGSLLTIDFFPGKTFVAEDTGGMIRRTHPDPNVKGYIDVYYGNDYETPSYGSEAMSFGRRKVKVTIIGDGKPGSGGGDGSTTVAREYDESSSRGASFVDAMRDLASDSGVAPSPIQLAPANQIPTEGGRFPLSGSVNAITVGERYVSEFARVVIDYDLQKAGPGGANVPQVIKTRALNLSKLIAEAEKEILYKYPSSNVNKVYSR